MIRPLSIAALALSIIITALVADTQGWLANTLLGNMLDQAAIVATGVAADLALPGSGISVIKALEMWWTLQ